MGAKAFKNFRKLLRFERQSLHDVGNPMEESDRYITKQTLAVIGWWKLCSNSFFGCYRLGKLTISELSFKTRKKKAQLDKL